MTISEELLSSEAPIAAHLEITNALREETQAMLANLNLDDEPIKIPHNIPCPCGSGVKHQECCLLLL